MKVGPTVRPVGRSKNSNSVVSPINENNNLPVKSIDSELLYGTVVSFKETFGFVQPLLADEDIYFSVREGIMQKNVFKLYFH